MAQPGTEHGRFHQQPMGQIPMTAVEITMLDGNNPHKLSHFSTEMGRSKARKFFIFYWDLSGFTRESHREAIRQKYVRAKLLLACHAR